MKKLLALLAVVGLAALAANSDASVRTYRPRLAWHNTVGGAASGFVDSSYFSGSAAARIDTSDAFSLDDMAPHEAGQTGLADTTSFSLAINIWPRPAATTTAGVTESAALITLQASNDGASWISVLVGADSLLVKPDEPLPNNLTTTYTTKPNFPGTDTGISRIAWWGYNLYRVLVRGDFNGEWVGNIAYLKDFPGEH